jgi:hypothetical protein
MGGGGPWRNHQLVGNLPVGPACGDEPEHLDFTLG